MIGAGMAIRLAIALAVLALMAGIYGKGRTDGRKLERLETAAGVIRANAEALHLERARQSRADDAGRLAATRAAGIADSARRVAGERDGLRDDLAAANEYAKESRAAAERTASLATGLLGRCTARYSAVAEGAARADSEARELRQGWPE